MKPKRREYWVGNPTDSYRKGDALPAWPEPSYLRPQDYHHVREVLPGDDEREAWVDELVRLCEKIRPGRPETTGQINRIRIDISNHLTKRES